MPAVPDVFKDLARFSFGGIEFPVDSYTLKGSGRQHVHIYLHVHGGDPEKLGRNLYEVEVSACFYNSDTKRPNLWPNRLELLRQLFESQTTDTLVIPSVGQFKAFATSWDQEFVSRILNGEKAKFRFIEDQSDAFLLDRFVSIGAVQTAAQNFANVTKDQALQDQLGDPSQKNLLDGIQELANSVFAFRDQAELGVRLLEERLTMLINLIKEADATVEFFKDPANYNSLEAMKELWVATVDARDKAAAENVAIEGNGAPLGRPHSGAGVAVELAYYVVPVDSMTISEVAIAIYGSTERAIELLQLNAIEDALVIPRNTKIRYAVPAV